MHTETFHVGNLELTANIAGDLENPAILLLHGWPHDRSLYDPVLEQLGSRYFVLAFDLPGIGDSRGVPDTAEKEKLADLMLTAAEQAGAKSIVVAGIDVGGMIAYAAARFHGSRVKGVAVGNTVIPGIDPWEKVLADPRIWHFAFHAVPDLPEHLVTGRERAYFDFFFNILGNKQRPLPEAMRARFAQAYARPEALKAGFDWYRAFPADAEKNAVPKELAIPILYFRGDADGRKADDYIAGLKAAGAKDVRPHTLPGTAEFTPVEAPDEFTRVLTDFATDCLAT